MKFPFDFSNGRLIATSYAANVKPGVAKLPDGFEVSGAHAFSNTEIGLVADNGTVCPIFFRDGAWVAGNATKPIGSRDVESISFPKTRGIAGIPGGNVLSASYGEESPARIHSRTLAGQPHFPTLDLRYLGIRNLEAHCWIPFGGRNLLVAVDQDDRALNLIDPGEAWGGTDELRTLHTWDAGFADCADLCYHDGTLYSLHDAANVLEAHTLGGYIVGQYDLPGTGQEALTILPDGRVCIGHDRGNGGEVFLYTQ